MLSLALKVDPDSISESPVRDVQNNKTQFIHLN